MTENSEYVDVIGGPRPLLNNVCPRGMLVCPKKIENGGCDALEDKTPCALMKLTQCPEGRW